MRNKKTNRKSQLDALMNKNLETCEYLTDRLRSHVKNCSQPWIHGADIFHEIFKFETELGDILSAQFLIRDTLGELEEYRTREIVVKLLHSFEHAKNEIFQNSAKKLLARLHGFHRKKSFHKCQSQDHASKSATSGRATTSYPSVPQAATTSDPISALYFHQHDTEQPWEVMRSEPFRRVEESIAQAEESPQDEHRDAQTLAERDYFTPIPTGDPSATVSAKNTVLPISIHPELSPNQGFKYDSMSTSTPNNKVLSQEDLIHRFSAKTTMNKQPSIHETALHETTEGDSPDTDACSDTSSLSLDAQGFIEARERDVRAAKCMERVEANIAKWKGDIEREQKRRAATRHT